MRKDEYVLTKELRRLEKYGFLLQAKRIGLSGDGQYIYDILFTEDKRVLEPGCNVSEIMGIINSLEICLNLYDLSHRTNVESKSADEAAGTQRPEERDLFSRLKRLRFEFARAERLPAFCIFSDKTLLEMCDRLPTNARELIRIKGVGKTKLDKYGDAFIKVILEYKKSDSCVFEGDQNDN